MVLCFLKEYISLCWGHLLTSLKQNIGWRGLNNLYQAALNIREKCWSLRVKKLNSLKQDSQNPIILSMSEEDEP
jgi:hypothetical protein